MVADGCWLGRAETVYGSFVCLLLFCKCTKRERRATTGSMPTSADMRTSTSEVQSGEVRFAKEEFAIVLHTNVSSERKQMHTQAKDHQQTETHNTQSNDHGRQQTTNTNDIPILATVRPSVEVSREHTESPRTFWTFHALSLREVHGKRRTPKDKQSCTRLTRSSCEKVDPQPGKSTGRRQLENSENAI